MESASSLLFIDTSVEGYQSLLNGVKPNIEVFLLDAHQNGIEQITQVLRQHPEAQAIHIISHGSPGCLHLGGTQLNLDTFEHYAPQLQDWFMPKREEPCTLLLYGCNVAAGDAGAEFVEKLHRFTGAAIAASTTPIGHASLGGNWHLDTSIGAIEPSMAIRPETQADWQGLLGPLLIAVSGPPTVAADGLSATYANVATLDDGTAVDLIGTVIAPASATAADIIFTTSGDDILLTITGELDLRWELVASGTATPVTADVNFTIADLDAFSPPESISAVADSFAVNNPTNLIVSASIGGEVSATGGAIQNGEPESAISLTFNNTSSFEVTFSGNSTDFEIDGDLDFAFADADPTFLAITAIDDDFSVDADAALTGNVLVDNGNGPDVDPEGDPLSVTAINGVAVAPSGSETVLVGSSGATVTINSDGTFSFDTNGGFDSLAPGETATETFTTTISDGSGNTDISTATITVNGIDDGPVEPSPVEPSPVEPSPVEPGPVEPGPVEPGPVEPIEPELGETGFFSFVQFSELFGLENPLNSVEAGATAFDESFYLASNQDVAAAVEAGLLSSGLEHFEAFGQAEGRAPVNSAQVDPFPLPLLFDESFYLAANPDVLDAVNTGFFSSGFEHFQAFGKFEGRDPSILFDNEFYLDTNTDVAAAVDAGLFDSGFEHFISFGQFEGRDPDELFDEDAYLAANPDVADALTGDFFESGFEHFLEFGITEGRAPTADVALFDEAFYLDQNADVAAAVANGIFSDGLEHFISFGQSEGRDPSGLFDQSSYLAANPDVAAAVSAGIFNSGFEHFEAFGRIEGREFFTT
ncbi:MAG: DUF4347 domain-containing protein [Cyanothece sp. SIO1E1]|nr:DUF4347 domain-containing protein [Cyanothece sp. SIO1E1]